MYRALNPVLAAWALVLVLAAAASAQAPTVPAEGGVISGSVTMYGSPVPDVEVTLHQVTSAFSGEIGSIVTGGDGRFRFPTPASDTSGFNVFFATVDHLGVRYFGTPVHAGEVPADYRVEVYDTAAASPAAIRVGRRDIILFPETDGSWSANELIRGVNDSNRTLVSRAGEPTWEFLLPPGALNFEVTEGMASEDEIRVIGDRVVYTGALPPGARELIVRYRLDSGGGLSLSAVSRTDTLSLYVPEAIADVEVSGLGSPQLITAENERFIRHWATDLPAGYTFSVEWTAGGHGIDPVAAALVVVLAFLGIGTYFGVRNRAPWVGFPPGGGPGSAPGAAGAPPS